MAEEEEVAVEYESDPEEANALLNMRRRREASDDEEQDEEDEDIHRFDDDSRVSGSQSEDAEGAAAEYHQQQDEDEDEEELEIEEEEEEEAGDLEKEEIGRSEVKAVAVELLDEQVLGDDAEVDLQFGEDNAVVTVVVGGKERKKNEPFAVPTAGAFYMHDDRFRDSVAGARGGGVHRRTLGGRKLWESKDDRKWGHDKFERMTIHESHYDEGRRVSRSRNRGRGKIQGEQREHPRGNRTKAYNGSNQNNAPNNQINVSNNQKNTIRGVRGRGPRKYQPVRKTYNEVPIHNKLIWKSVENNSHASSGRVSAATSKTESDPIPARKHVLSSLNSASPPFYPSASSNKDVCLTQKMDGQARPLRRELQSFVTDDTFPIPQSNILRGKNVAHVAGVNKLNIDKPVATHTEKPMTNLQLQASGSSLINSSQPLQSRVQGRNQTPLGKMNYQSNAPHNQVNRVATPSQFINVQQGPVHPRGQTSVQQLEERSGGGIKALSPPNAVLAIHSFESKETESLPELSKSRTTMNGRGRGSLQGNGKGTFPYGGATITGSSGNMASTHGDQEFSTTPTFFPVMQFGGQHSGGVGVPTVGMAFPGYVGNPASGNSEMTWLPVLAGPAGALGAPYCSPYLSVDGSYHALPSGLTPSLLGASSKENNINIPGNNDLKPSQRPDLAKDEFRQQQNKTRRYTEMKFDQ